MRDNGSALMPDKSILEFMWYQGLASLYTWALSDTCWLCVNMWYPLPCYRTEGMPLLNAKAMSLDFPGSKIMNSIKNSLSFFLIISYGINYRNREMGWMISFFKNISRRPPFFRFWSLLPCIKTEATNQWPTDVFCLAHNTVAQIAPKTN